MTQECPTGRTMGLLDWFGNDVDRTQVEILAMMGNLFSAPCQSKDRTAHT
jgi:hypothetical protein